MLPYKPIHFNSNTFRGIRNYIYFDTWPIKLKLLLFSPMLTYLQKLPVQLLTQNYKLVTNKVQTSKPWLTHIIDNDNPYILSCDTIFFEACYRIGPKLRWIILVSCYSQQVSPKLRAWYDVETLVIQGDGLLHTSLYFWANRNGSCFKSHYTFFQQSGISLQFWLDSCERVHQLLLFLFF